MQVAFLEKHHYHTATSKKKRNEKKQQNLEEVRARLKSYKQVEK
jgi:hypothetical protein